MGLFVAALGCRRVTITDLEEVCPLTTANVEANLASYPLFAKSVTVWATRSGSSGCGAGVPYRTVLVQVRALCWGTDDWRGVTDEMLPESAQGQRLGTATYSVGAGVGGGSGERLLVLAADCVYHVHLFAAFAESLHSLCTRRGAIVLMAHTPRWRSVRLQLPSMYDLMYSTGACICICICIYQCIAVAPPQRHGCGKMRYCRSHSSWCDAGRRTHSSSS